MTSGDRNNQSRETQTSQTLKGQDTKRYRNNGKGRITQEVSGMKLVATTKRLGAPTAIAIEATRYPKR